uniref:Pseudo-response regulator 37 splice variant a n=1 Tax=Sorghum bicolor TaxID=4558 RepID=G4XFJ9_SORBI|nr:pseudo-response regulator 37 splice variant a [Sorghum bicolor]AEG90646.1 pseudo-response regulator 37 splice variant b [Sorghum bicolor]AEG90647.1 pseudo-response regulator 37 splice variant c [Sorghum bicolor]AEG90648.1 pseudo-response regulator 37 splice variant d [Sorghum bicolor]AEG90649.1 pseudo-response regulator 37 splice variant e [Sorghum bicolor]
MRGVCSQQLATVDGPSLRDATRMMLRNNNNNLRSNGPSDGLLSRPTPAVLQMMTMVVMMIRKTSSRRRSTGSASSRRRPSTSCSWRVTTALGGSSVPFFVTACTKLSLLKMASKHGIILKISRTT